MKANLGTLKNCDISASTSNVLGKKREDRLKKNKGLKFLPI